MEFVDSALRLLCDVYELTPFIALRSRLQEEGHKMVRVFFADLMLILLHSLRVCYDWLSSFISVSSHVI